MKLLTKITLKDINNLKSGVLKKMCAESETAVFVGRIVGSVRSQFVKDSPFGPALGFKGSFVAYGIDGEESRATVAYLPNPVDQMLSDQINELMGDKDRLESPVDFALDVFAVQDKGETGYKFLCKPLLETAVADPIQALLRQVQPLKLSAPEPETSSTPDDGPATETPALDAPETEKPAKTGKK